MGILKKLIERATVKAVGDLAQDENHRFIYNNYLFKGISDKAYLFLTKRLVERHYTQDELIFKQDNPGVCMFIVKQGSVEIYFRKHEDDSKIVYANVDKGSLFGEISIVSSAYRAASAKATKNNTILLTLSTFDIEDLNRDFPQDGLKVLKEITNTVISNLQNTTKKLQEANAKIEELSGRLEKYETTR